MKDVLVISDRDNVATALVALEAGRRLAVGSAVVTTLEPIARGHKLALRAIAAGEAVVKYGSPIGVASVEIAAGAHVHTHNLVSSRGRGDLEPPPHEPAARLAEPPDDAPDRQGSAPDGLADVVETRSAAGTGSRRTRVASADQ